MEYAAHLKAQAHTHRHSSFPFSSTFPVCMSYIHTFLWLLYFPLITQNPIRKSKRVRGSTSLSLLTEQTPQLQPKSNPFVKAYSRLLITAHRHFAFCPSFRQQQKGGQCTWRSNSNDINKTTTTRRYDDYYCYCSL